MSKFGYAGSILKVDLSSGAIVDIPTGDYADRFIGGRGMAAKLFWDNVPPQTKALDPENCLIFSTGPLAGFTRIAGSRWQVCGQSPAMAPQYFSHGNIGGSWGATLKFAGYDAMMVQGKADKPVYIFVRDGKAEIRDASLIWGKDAFETQEILKAELGKDVRVACCGPAGEHLVSFATVMADEGSSGSSGLGSVMGSKKLKAVAVAGNKRPVAANPEKLSAIADRIFEMRAKHWPTEHKWVHEGKTKRHTCYGCVAGCLRQYYKMENGKQVKFFCQMGDMYETAAMKYYGDWNEVVVQATDICQIYGLDTFVIEPMVAWLDKCYQGGILKEDETGLPLSKIGSLEFMEILAKKISWREGFGDVLAQGTWKAADLVGKGSRDLIGDSITTRASDLAMYDPRLFITNGLLYATEPRKPIQQLHELSLTIHEWVGLKGVGLHEGGAAHYLTAKDWVELSEKFWGSAAGGDLTTYDGKALAAKRIQDRNYAKESLGLCDFVFPIIFTRTADGEVHVGAPDIQSQIFSAVTGVETDEAGLNRYGERIYNLQRAVRLREGWPGRAGDTLLEAFYRIPVESVRFNPDCVVPGPGGEPVAVKGAVVVADKFEKEKDEFYQLRGWDVASGLPTKARLLDLDLADVAADLEKRGLAK